MDIQIINCGSVALLAPCTEAGEAWLRENVGAEDWQWMNGAIACEPRYVADVVSGAVDDGLEVER